MDEKNLAELMTTAVRKEVKNYDFDFLLKQNDYLAGVLKDLLEQRKALSLRMKDFESRLKALEVA